MQRNHVSRIDFLECLDRISNVVLLIGREMKAPDHRMNFFHAGGGLSFPAPRPSDSGLTLSNRRRTGWPEGWRRAPTPKMLRFFRGVPENCFVEMRQLREEDIMRIAPALLFCLLTAAPAVSFAADAKNDVERAYAAWDAAFNKQDSKALAAAMSRLLRCCLQHTKSRRVQRKSRSSGPGSSRRA
jgi:hypothetical protein